MLTRIRKWPRHATGRGNGGKCRVGVDCSKVSASNAELISSCDSRNQVRERAKDCGMPYLELEEGGDITWSDDGVAYSIVSPDVLTKLDSVENNLNGSVHGAFGSDPRHRSDDTVWIVTARLDCASKTAV